MAEIDRRLADVAARQRMLLTLDDVRAAGGSRRNVHDRIAGGRWRRVEHGVYQIAGAPLDWATKELALVLAGGPGSAASFFAAARLFGFGGGFRSADLEISIPRGHKLRRTTARIHESTDLDRCRIVTIDGVPTTDPARTLLDLGRYLGVQRLTRVVEAARREDHVDWSSLIATLARHARRGRPGVRRLRAVILAGAHRDEVTDSDVELLVLGLLTEAGLPEPVLHHRVYANGRFVAEVDLAYPGWRIAIECDGDIHLRSDVRERDLPRQNDLVLEGWTILRFSRERVWTRPESIVSEVRTAVRQAARRSVA